jgi:HK97 family phage portal protein
MFRRTDAVSQMAAMGSVGILFSIVNRTSNATAAVDWHLYRKAKSGKKEDRVEVTSHAAIDLWNKPNPFMPRQEFVETSQQHVDLTGESFWVVARDKRFKVPLELWPVRPDRMMPVADPEKFLTGWIYVSPDGEQVPLGLDEVIQLRMPNPLDLYRGMGPVQAILTDLDAVKYSAEWNRNFFLNSAEPGGIIEVEKRLSDDEFDELSMRWEEQHRGVSRAHRVAILEQGKWIDRKYTMRDMQFAELRAVGRDTIIEAFGMHKIAIGISDDVNRASATAGKTLFAEDLTVPRLERHKGALNNDFLPLFGDTARDLEWDYDSPVPADEEAENAARTSKATAAKTYIDAGFTGESVVDALELPDTLVWEKPAPQPAFGHLPTEQPAPAVGPGPAGPTPAEPGAPLPPANTAAELLAAFRQRHIDTAAGGPLRNADLPEPAGDWPESDEDAVNAVDLGPVQVAWEAALAALLETWQASVVADWIRQLIDAVKDILGGDDRAGLATLEVDVTDAVATLTTAMATFGETAAGHAVDEASTAGVDLTAHWPAAADLEDAARQVAEFEARRYGLTAGREAARVAGPEPDVDVVGDHLDQFLNEMSDAGARSALGGALTDSQNLARAATFTAGPVGALYASEAMDSNTCRPCREVHGRFIATTEDLAPLLKLYPTGGYIDCLGRWRCRGTWVGVWRPETTEGGQ